MALRPVKAKKTKTKDRYFHYVVMCNESQIVIQKRIEKDIWQHLYQFPMTETGSSNPPSELHFGLNIKNALSISEEHIHILSHQKIHARFYKFPLLDRGLNEEFKVVNFIDLKEYPLPRLIDRFLEKEY